MGTLHNPRAVENLIPIRKGDLSSEEAARRGSAGGKKSGEVRRRKRELKESLEVILQGGQVQEDMCFALVAKALKGDVRAF